MTESYWNEEAVIDAWWARRGSHYPQWKREDVEAHVYDCIYYLVAGSDETGWHQLASIHCPDAARLVRSAT